MTRDELSSHTPSSASQTEGKLIEAALRQEHLPASVRRHAPALPERIGPYKIIRRIGAGGMGVVYEAEQTEPNRRVALKVIRTPAGADSTDARLFQREIQVLGRFRHASIAGIYDAGYSDGGQQYFVMELIDGLPLVEYCDSAGLPMRDRLTLFARVCEAVQYAHQRGVIHRDLKPANILVDKEGMPHVLDFGVARILDPGSELSRSLLEGQALIGTLPYMSPEQARADTADLDVRTDVYSLGVILYEMLTGQYPYPVIGQMADVLKNIAEAEPKKPSTFRRQINDEVETIILTALAKEKERRYQSAGTLARDVEHYLAGEAIDAKRDSGWYVFKKMARRYKTPVAVSIAFTVVLATAAVISRIQYAKAETARGEAVAYRKSETRQRSLAEEARDEAEAVTRFLTDTLAAVDPEKQGKDVPLREVLDRAAEKIGEKFADKPLIEARLRWTVGRTYLGLGLYAKAEAHITEAAAFYRREKGPRHPMTLGALESLAIVLGSRGGYTEAAARFKAVLEIRRRVLGEEHVATLGSMSNLAAALGNQGKHAEAEALHRKTLAIQRRVLGEEHPSTLNSKSNLASALVEQGKYAEVEEMDRKTLEARRHVLGDEHPDTLISLNNLASTLRARGKYAEAEALHREHLEIVRRVLGEEHPGTLLSIYNLAVALRIQGRYKEAETLFRNTLDLQRRVLGEEHPNTLGSMNSLANALDDQGKYTESEALYRKTLDIQRRVLGEEHQDTLGSMSNLAGSLRDRGRYVEAEALNRKTLDIRRRILGEEHPGTLASMNNLGNVLSDLGKYLEAEEMDRRTLGIIRRVLGEKHPDTLISANNLASGLCIQGKYTEAEELHRKTLDIRRSVLGDEHPAVLASMGNLLSVLNAQNRSDEARALAEKLIEYRRRRAEIPYADRKDLIEYASLLLTCKPEDLRKPKTALPLAQRAAEETGESNYAMLLTLALAYQMTGNIDQAVETQRKSLKLLPPDSTPLRTELQTVLGEYLVEQGTHAEAEPLLLDGYRALAARKYVKTDDRRELIERLIKLYESWNVAEPGKGYAEKAADWQAKISHLDPMNNGPH